MDRYKDEGQEDGRRVSKARMWEITLGLKSYLLIGPWKDVRHDIQRLVDEFTGVKNSYYYFDGHINQDGAFGDHIYVNKPVHIGSRILIKEKLKKVKKDENYN